MAQQAARSPGLEEWRPLAEYHPVVRLVGQWCWDQASRGLPPPSPGGFAVRVGIPRKVMSGWTTTTPTDGRPAYTLERAAQIAIYTQLPLRDLLTAGGVLSPDEPVYTRADAMRYVADLITSEHAQELELPFEPSPVVDWLRQRAVAVGDADQFPGVGRP